MIYKDLNLNIKWFKLQEPWSTLYKAYVSNDREGYMEFSIHTYWT